MSPHLTGATVDIAKSNMTSREIGWVRAWLLPLLCALVLLAVAREWTLPKLHAMRGWLEQHARTLAAVIIVLLAVALLRNGIVGLTS